MTEKKLYALTDEHVEALKVWAGYGLYISTDHKELDETADAIHALTPVTVDDLGDDAIERMARAILQKIYRGNVDILGCDIWVAARGDARAALAALLGSAGNTQPGT